MVIITTVLNAVKEIKLPRRYLRTKFLDSVRLHVKGGTGGMGLPKYGGRGGPGGYVYCIGKDNATLNTLLKKYRSKSIIAGHGEDSRKSKIIGSPGTDIKLEVPLGVKIYGENGKVLGAIDKEDSTIVVAHGGHGGDDSNQYQSSSGEVHHIRLDLKLIADVGLVGFPNAGKSSLLRSISKAKPRIANYPFTTMKPNMGIIQYKDLYSISMADLPGLIEGAHNNKGLGHQFLRHVERTKILVLIADINGFQLSPQYPWRSCIETILLLNKELELYDPEMLDKPAILAINKLDVDGAEDKFRDLLPLLTSIDNERHNLPEELRPERIVEFQKVIGISALMGQGIDELKHCIRIMVDELGKMINSEFDDEEEIRNKTHD